MTEYKAQVEHIVKIYKERSTAGQKLMYVGCGTGLTSILLHLVFYTSLSSPFIFPISNLISISPIRHNSLDFFTIAPSRHNLYHTYTQQSLLLVSAHVRQTWLIIEATGTPLRLLVSTKPWHGSGLG